MRRLVVVLFAVALSLHVFSCAQEQKNDEETIKMLKDKIAQFVPTEVKYDDSILDERQKIVVEKLYQAAKVMDEIFCDQVYAKNKEIRAKLEKSKSAVDAATLEYFNIMAGPFDRLNHNRPFYGEEMKPLGANFYPADMTKSDFRDWIKDHPDQEEAFTSEFTVIRKEGDALTAIPYSEYYKEPLSRAAKFMMEAADYADNPSLKKYLLSRAKAFGTNDYFQSDMDWMDLQDNLIEVVIGPYEVYEDGLFNYKAAFECFLTIKDPQESDKLAIFEKYLDEIEEHLPNPKEQKNFKRGKQSPIVVANEIFSAGDTKAGVQTLAFNLPNDERVREAKGSKKVMLKNLHEAKFNKLLKPIAEKILDKEQLPLVTFDGFFNHTLMHEISHGVGPGKLTLNGRETEVKKELKETYSKIEECKADVLGMYNNVFMIEKGVYPESFKNEMWVTFLASVFRSIRFGISEAHGAGNAIIYNYLLEKGAYEYNEESKTVKVNFSKIYDAVRELANKLLVIEGTGDYEGAKELIDKYAGESASISALRDKLSDLPVDIRPIFAIEKK